MHNTISMGMRNKEKGWMKIQHGRAGQGGKDKDGAQPAL